MWYQADDLQISIKITDTRGYFLLPGDLSFKAKLKLFIWNRLLTTRMRLKFKGSRFDGWISAGD